MQLSVNNNMEIGLPGQLYGIGPYDIDDFVNGSMQLDLISVTAPNLATTLTINSTAFTVNAEAATKTIIELGAMLVAAVNAGSEPVTATDLLNGTLYIRANVHGTAFTAVGTTNCTVAHKVINEATIPFGVLVVRDKWSGLVKSAHLPSLTGEITGIDTCLGVTVHSHASEQGYADAANPGYAAYSAMSVIRKGLIYVKVENAVSPGGLPYVRFTANATEQLGSFRADTDSGDAVALPHSVFESAAIANGIALLRLGTLI